MKNFYYIITITLLLFFSLFMFLKNCSLETQIEEINNRLQLIYITENSEHIQNPLNAILDYQFKDNLVLNQLNNTTAILLTFTSIIVAILGFISFKTIYKDLNKNKKAIVAQVNKSEIILQNINLIEKRINTDLIGIENIKNENLYYLCLDELTTIQKGLIKSLIPGVPYSINLLNLFNKLTEYLISSNNLYKRMQNTTHSFSQNTPNQEKGKAIEILTKTNQLLISLNTKSDFIFDKKNTLKEENILQHIDLYNSDEKINSLLKEIDSLIDKLDTFPKTTSIDY